MKCPHCQCEIEVSVSLAPKLRPPARPSDGVSSDVQHVQAAVCEHYRLSVNDLLSTSRSAHLSQPRQVAVYLASELVEGASEWVLGELFLRDPSTIPYSVRRGKALPASTAHALEIAALREVCSTRLGRKAVARNG